MSSIMNLRLSRQAQLFLALVVTRQFSTPSGQTVCSAGQRVDQSGSGCRTCSHGTFVTEASHNRSICEQWQVCDFHHFQSAEGSSTTDRECTLCGHGTGPACPSGQFEVAPCTPTTDRRCTQCSSCAGASTLGGCNHSHDTICSVALAAVRATTQNDDGDTVMIEAVVLTCCVAVIIASIGSVTYTAAHKMKQDNLGRQFWWSIEDAIEFECSDKNVLAQNAAQRRKRLEGERTEAEWLAETLLDRIIDSAVVQSESHKREVTEAQAEKQLRTLLLEKEAAENLLKATHEHYEESRLAIREGREDRERELSELTERLEAVSARDLPEDELAALQMEVRRLTSNCDNATERRDAALTDATRARDDCAELERQLQELENEINALASPTGPSASVLAEERDILQKRIQDVHKGRSAELAQALQNMEAKAALELESQHSTHEFMCEQNMVDEDAEEAQRTRALYNEHEEFLAQMRRGIQQQETMHVKTQEEGYIDVASSPETNELGQF